MRLLFIAILVGALSVSGCATSQVNGETAVANADGTTEGSKTPRRFCAPGQTGKGRC